MNKEKQNLKSIFLLTKCFSVRMEEYTHTTLTITAHFGLRFTTPRQVSVWQKEYIPTLTLATCFSMWKKEHDYSTQPFQGLIMKLEKDEEYEL